jgi:DNA-binding Lrp family transcriptional regulator
MEKSDGHKWVLLSDDKAKGYIITDVSMIAEFIGVSPSTIRRRIRSEGEDFILKGYRIMSLPYYKSRRGQ